MTLEEAKITYFTMSSISGLIIQRLKIKLSVKIWYICHWRPSFAQSDYFAQLCKKMARRSRDYLKMAKKMIFLFEQVRYYI